MKGHVRTMKGGGSIKAPRRLTVDRETTGLGFCDLNNDLLLRYAPGRLFFKKPSQWVQFELEGKGRAWQTLAGPSLSHWPANLSNVWSVGVALVDYCSQMISCASRAVLHTLCFHHQSNERLQAELGKRSCRAIYLSNNFSLF